MSDPGKKGPEIDAEQVEALQIARSLLHPSLQCLMPLLDSLREQHVGVIPTHRKSLPTRQATDFKRTIAATDALGIDYQDDDSAYFLDLKSEYLQKSKPMAENFATVIEDIKSSKYINRRSDELFCRTVLDLIMVDRLRQLEDRDAARHLQVSAEVQVSVVVQDVYGNNEIIKGRVDWAIGYGKDKSNTGAILLVVEAKPYESSAIGMPQLLVAMAAVQKARENRTNKSVFGMVSDSKVFRFAFLSEEKKLFISGFLEWARSQSEILAFLDMILSDAIESSPHTSRQKDNNQIPFNYSKHLESHWNFGPELGE